MSETEVKEVEYGLPEYVDGEQMKSNAERVRITNLTIDSLNSKKVFFQEFFIGNTDTVITGMPEYGSFIVCVQGEERGMPGGVFCYASNGESATTASLVTQNGTGDWSGIGLIVGSSSGKITFRHSGADVQYKFYLTVLGYF